MLIPIGHDKTELKRWPVLSLGILVLCVFVYFFRGDPTPQEEQQIEARLIQAAAYRLKHPELKADPLVERVAISLRKMMGGSAADEDYVANFLDDAEEDEDANGEEEEDLSLSERQAKLDRLTAEWRASMSAFQAWRWGHIPSEPNFLRLFTSMFIHGGLLHLFGNMLFLYLTGPFIEDKWGRPFYLFLYIVGGLVAAQLDGLRHPDQVVPLIGASGAISALLGAFLLRYPTAQIKFLLFLLWRPVRFDAPVYLMLPLWFLLEYWSAAALESGSDGVAHWAHIYGFLFGAFIAGSIRWLKIEEVIMQPLIDKKIEEARPIEDLALHRAGRAIDAGNVKEAMTLMETQLTSNPGNQDAALVYWDLVRRTRQFEHATPTLLRVIHAGLKGKDPAAAVEHWQELREAAPNVRPPLWLLVPLARRCQQQGLAPMATELVAQALPLLGKSASSDTLVQLARVATRLELSHAADLRRRAMEHPGTSEEDRSDFRITELAEPKEPRVVVESTEPPKFRFADD